MKKHLKIFSVFFLSFVFTLNIFAQSASSKQPCGQAYYVSIFGQPVLNISDEKGGKLIRKGDFLVNTVDGLSNYEMMGENAVMLIFNAQSGVYSIEFRAPANEALAIEAVKGCGNSHPNLAVRFLDVSLPANAKAQIRISPSGVSDLFYDKDGDGKLESVLKPTVRVSGAAADDSESPRVSIYYENRGVNALVTIKAEDASGIKAIRYSLDGVHYQYYKEPFQVEFTTGQVTIDAFAEDNVGLRGTAATKKFRFVPEKRTGLTNLPF